MARRERISTVLRRAQLLHLEKRTEHAWRLHLQSLDQWMVGRCWMGPGSGIGIWYDLVKGPIGELSAPQADEILLWSPWKD
jgi:hypothetical protein